MRLLDLVEEHHGVGAAAHRLGELPALLEAHVARRRADEPRHGVLLHVLRHVDAHHRVLVVEEELRERTGRLRLADAGGSEEDERADRPVRILQPGARPAHRVRDGRDGLALSDHPLAEVILEMGESLALRLQEARHGNPGPLADDLGDVVGVDLLLEELLLLLQLGETRPTRPRSAASALGISRS